MFDTFIQHVSVYKWGKCYWHTFNDSVVTMNEIKYVINYYYYIKYISYQVAASILVK